MGGKLGCQCREPRCPEIVSGGGGYCEKHKGNSWSNANSRERLPFYHSARWLAIRKLKLGKDPICEVCTQRFATQVHHIKKARDYPELRFVMSNLQSICLWCHSKETQKETRETINANKTTPDN